MRTDTRLPRAHEGLWLACQDWSGLLYAKSVEKVVVLHRISCLYRVGNVIFLTEDFFAAILSPGIVVCGHCFMEVRPGTEILARNPEPQPRWRQRGHREQQARRWAPHRAYAARHAFVPPGGWSLCP